MREMAPYLQLMVDGVREGMTCSLEEHKDVRNVALDWLAEQDEATRSLLFVYSVFKIRCYTYFFTRYMV